MNVFSNDFNSVHHIEILVYVYILFQMFILFLENKRDKREYNRKKENNGGFSSRDNHKNSLYGKVRSPK